MNLSPFDYEMMALAIQEAKKGLYTASPNPRVGCVIAKNRQIISKGWHLKPGEPHAEINALIAAKDEAEGADCYVSLEPCSHYGRTGPCAVALVEAKVRRVVVAGVDPNPRVAGNGVDILQRAGVEVVVGCLEQEAMALNPGFFKRMRTGKPYVRVKMAASLDGKTALANGVSQWITSPEAREDVQALRAQSSAIITGSGTLLADDPSLTVRSLRVLEKGHGAIRQPLRVVLDSSGTSRPEHKIFRSSQPDTGEEFSEQVTQSILFTHQEKISSLKHQGFGDTVEIKSVSTDDLGRLDLDSVLSTLGQKECNEVLVEAGSTLAGAFIQADLVDEVWMYLAPKLLGLSGQGMFDLSVFSSLEEVKNLTIRDLRSVGRDIRIIAEVC